MMNRATLTLTLMLATLSFTYAQVLNVPSIEGTSTPYSLRMGQGQVHILRLPRGAVAQIIGDKTVADVVFNAGDRTVAVNAYKAGRSTLVFLDKENKVISTVEVTVGGSELAPNTKERTVRVLYGSTKPERPLAERPASTFQCGDERGCVAAPGNVRTPTSSSNIISSPNPAVPEAPATAQP
jgi:hypothetical protein